MENYNDETANSGATIAQENKTATAAKEKSFSTGSITRSTAIALIEAALASAKKMGVELSVAVTDGGGNLKAFERTDRSPFLTGEVAINKAWTAVSYNIPTHVWNNYLADPKVAPLANIPRLMPVGGGFPVKEGDNMIGGFGVSGGTYQQDQQIAEDALRAVGFEIPK